MVTRWPRLDSSLASGQYRPRPEGHSILCVSKNAIRILKDVKDIGFTYFSPKDVVRHPLVQRVIEAYEKGTP